MKDRAVHIVSWLWIRVWEKSGYWNEIDKIADCLYISSIPMRENEKNLMDKIAKDGPPLMLVVSAVEDYEITETLPFMDPTRKEEWESKFHVNQKQAKLKDFSSGNESNIDEIAKTILTIQKHRDNKQSVLVHCKAGRTRSAMIAAVVLAVFDLGVKPDNVHKTPRQLIDMAVAVMGEKRTQIKVHDDVRETGAKLVQIVRDMVKKSAEQKADVSDIKQEAKSLPTVSLKDKLDALFSNSDLRFKEEILKLDAYKNLYMYRQKLMDEASFFRSPKRAEHITKIFTNLTEAKDSGWLKELIIETGPVHDLVNANPRVTDKIKEKQTREDLIDKLKNDVESLICVNLGYSSQELETLYQQASTKQESLTLGI